MTTEAGLGDAIDLSHHLSEVSKNRGLSPLKGLQKYFGKPGMLSLAGGTPSPVYFPFDNLKADALVCDSFSTTARTQNKGALSWLWDLFSNTQVSTTPISIPKYAENPNEIDLAVSLQYGLARGIPQLQKFVQEFSRKVYKPPYDNFATLLHTGNTDGWMKAVTTFCNPGEGVLTSEWTYPSAIATMAPCGIRAVPVSMDGQGMSSNALREVLVSWDAQTHGMPRPHVMYCVPVGQNPTGATMQMQRKKEIYDICVEFDIIIVEDDPYYFLQEGPYILPYQRASALKESEPGDEEYLRSLAPSFLAFDYQGRVVRLDTFSKTIAPGSRLGWFTCNPLFAERLERQSETSTQAPCGFGQSLVTKLLLDWKFTGYLRWLKGLGVEYRRRRDFFIDCIVETFHIELAPPSQNMFHGSEMYLASAFIPSSVPDKCIKTHLFSFVPPTSGMFVWLKLHFDSHPKVGELGHKTLEMKLWVELAEAGLLVGPGSMFSANPSGASPSDPGHFRISFSYAEFKDLRKAVEILDRVLKKFYRDL